MTRTAPEIRVAVSTVIFSLRRRDTADGATIVLPLVKRTRDPHEGQWALPGGWLDGDEGLERAASRTLAETTTLTPSYLEQLYAFGDPGRSPGRVVSIVYWALVREDVSLESEQHNVAWFDATALPALAFDHNQMVTSTRQMLTDKLWRDLAFTRALTGPEFPVSAAVAMTRSLSGSDPDRGNLNRRLQSVPGLNVGHKRVVLGRGRPGALWVWAEDAVAQEPVA